MNLEEYRVLFTVVSLSLILVAASPVLSMVISIPGGEEPLSELWVLSLEGEAGDYPLNINLTQVGQRYNITVGVGNHLGDLAYYVVHVKFRNQTQPLPSTVNSIPSPLNSIYEFQFVLADGKTWEAPLNLSFQGEPAFVRNVVVNDVVSPVNCSSTWDPKTNGFFYQLFFELWLFDIASQMFRFHNRSVGIWLNMTR